MTSATALDRTFRLDPVHERMLEVALLRDGRAGERWRALRREIDLDDLWDGKALDLLPMVYRGLTDEAADDPDLPRLRGVHRRTWFANQLRFQALGRGLRLLTDAGVETLVLKGAAWALTAYPDAGLRPMHDCDVLVPRVLALLEDLRTEDVAAVVAGGEPPHADEYRGLELLIVTTRARREQLFERFLAFWTDLERDGFRARLEYAIEERSEEAAA